MTTAPFFWMLPPGRRVLYESMAARSVEERSKIFLDLSIPLRILDLGCGRGRTRALIRAYQGFEYIGVYRANVPPDPVSELLYRFA